MLSFNVLFNSNSFFEYSSKKIRANREKQDFFHPLLTFTSNNGLFFSYILLVFYSFSQAVNGGLVMVAFYPHFLSCAEKATIKDVVGKFLLLFFSRFYVKVIVITIIYDWDIIFWVSIRKRLISLILKHSDTESTEICLTFDSQFTLFCILIWKFHTLTRNDIGHTKNFISKVQFRCKNMFPCLFCSMRLQDFFGWILKYVWTLTSHSWSVIYVCLYIQFINPDAILTSSIYYFLLPDICSYVLCPL